MAKTMAKTTAKTTAKTMAKTTAKGPAVRATVRRAAPRVVVALTGASGAIYGLRLLRFLLASGAHVDLVISPSGQRVLREESEYAGEPFAAFLGGLYGRAIARGSLTVHSWGDIGAAIASGSVPTRGMIVAPCSMGTLSGIVTGRASNLIERAADVTLKEGRPLVLVPRETPLNLIHVDNMRRAIRAGIHLVPAMPAFYFGPRTIDDLADFIVARAAGFLGFSGRLYRPWSE
jgi:4-hydroxy-3-polyprenylbenzoate decarboxylase